jgi:hypothetical protein
MYIRGSEWRRWDLHLHTASSYDYGYKGDDADQLLCDALHSNEIAAVAITDHFLIDANRIRHLRSIAPDIVFFPGVELRTDKGANNLHLIMIFSNLTDLDILSADFDAWKRDKAKSADSDETIYWTFEDAVSFGERHNALLTIHAGKKTNGLDKEINNSLPYKEAMKADIAKAIHFFEVNRKKDETEYRTIVFEAIDEKPIIICSDNHDPRDYSVKEKLWIKADVTFEGLKQCLYQPRQRVFIGTIPPALDRENKNKRNNIAKVAVHRIDDPRHNNLQWFDFELPFNSGLIAIIGNKGSGKSALSDIVGQLCKCTTMHKAAFLNDKRFRKAPNNYAADYVATVTWGDGHTSDVALDVDDFGTIIEDAQYLPQQYIEDVCNDMGSEFQSEIDRVIFSYVDTTERGTATNLKELVDNRSAAIGLQIEGIKREISTINGTIIHLEGKMTSAYAKRIADSLIKMQETLERHERTKPKEVKKPVPSEGNEEYQKNLTAINTAIEAFQEQISQLRNDLTTTNTYIEETKELIAKIELIEQSVQDTKSIVNDFFVEHGLSDIDHSMVLTSPIQALSDYLKGLQNKRNECLRQINGDDDTEGLEDKLKKEREKKDGLIDTADAEEKAYQKYLKDLDDWEKEKRGIIGDANTEDTMVFFQNESEYLRTKLQADYQNARSKRNDLLFALFSYKQNLMSIYQEIYAPVEKEIDTLLGELEDRVVFDAEIQLIENDFVEKVLAFVNHKHTGIFKGKTDAHKLMERLLKGTDFQDKNSLLELLNKVMKAVDEDIDNSDKKISDKDAFYEYLYGLDYIGVTFKLKVGDRNLDELSPGERGIVLLIFYLALNKNSTPIIIDQPEDNLDNQSVYSKLVPCICAAKNRRQVIIVTHNPNIAVACDAEQIIYCDMDKNGRCLSYSAGSIENDDIKQHVIDVLEGTMPAFDLRRRKYTKSEL